MDERFIVFKYSYFINLFVQLLFLIFFRDVAFHLDDEHLGRFKGSFSHKNALASILMCQFFLYTLHFYLVKETQRNKILKVEFIVSTILLLFFVFLSESITVLICLLLFIAIIPLPLKVFNRKVVFTLCLVLPFIVFVLSSSFSYYIDIFGRDLTFTGRIVIWPLVIDAVNEKLLLGHGYMWFWNGGDIHNYTSLDWIIEFGNAHNFFLEVALSYGVFGLIALLIILITKFESDNFYNKFYITFLVIFITYGFFESAFFYVNNFQLFLLFFVFLSNKRNLFR
ncbi:O-antigen ligase family protein [Pseudoalteromonas sp. B62]|uniref:O-antigen ligase family protein n=1 Tax=Pseudoalteromonas sp. B62 TaxID=630483 RepID=UPI00301DD4A8